MVGAGIAIAYLTASPTESPRPQSSIHNRISQSTIPNPQSSDRQSSIPQSTISDQQSSILNPQSMMASIAHCPPSSSNRQTVPSLIATSHSSRAQRVGRSHQAPEVRHGPAA
jgi:hypothetical protein